MGSLIQVIYNKFCLYLVCFLGLHPTLTFCQNYLINYKLSIHSDSTNPNLVFHEKAILFIENGSKSYFFTENFAKKDSILSLIGGGKVSAFDIVGNPSNLNHTKLNQHVTKVYSTNEVEIFENILMTNYLYKFSIQFNWKIQSDSAIINGYRCQKAIGFFGGRIYEAWFTREIPISDGPYVFCGLPGLIVELYDTQKFYTFTFLSLGKQESYTILISPYNVSKAVSTTRQQAFAVRERLRKEPMEVLKMEGIQIIETPELEQIRKLKQKSDNNPIELRID